MALGSSLSKAAVIVTAALLCGGLVGWLASRNPADQSAPSTPPSTSVAPPAATPTVTATNSARTQANLDYLQKLRAARKARTADDPNATPAESVFLQKIDDIILADTDVDKKSEQILALLPTLTDTEQRVEAAQHLVNFVTDTNYTDTAKLLLNPKTDEPVLQTLMADLLNRGNELKVPLFLQLAKDEKHPMKTEARELLLTYIQEDHGTDWEAWDKAVQQWLKESAPSP